MSNSRPIKRYLAWKIWSISGKNAKKGLKTRYFCKDNYFDSDFWALNGFKWSNNHYNLLKNVKYCRYMYGLLTVELFSLEINGREVGWFLEWGPHILCEGLTCWPDSQYIPPSSIIYLPAFYCRPTRRTGNCI
jgi:hypothetical protein